MSSKFQAFTEDSQPVNYLMKSEVGLKWCLPPLNRFTLLFPRGVSRIRIGEYSSLAPASMVDPLNLTSSSFVFCPPKVTLHLEALTVYAHVAVLQPSSARWKEHEIENQLSQESIAAIQTPGFRKLRLTRWLDDLIDRYDFERRLNARSPSQCSFFVEKQILNEVIRILCPNEVPTTGELVGVENRTELSRALSWIEENVFHEINGKTIAEKMDMSVGQLSKIFQSELNCTPSAYVSDLRLEYAARFLERREFTPSDLASMCGFSELSAFSRAFKRKFGVAPSDYKGP